MVMALRPAAAHPARRRAVAAHRLVRGPGGTADRAGAVDGGRPAAPGRCVVVRHQRHQRPPRPRRGPRRGPDGDPRPASRPGCWRPRPASRRGRRCPHPAPRRRRRPRAVGGDGPLRRGPAGPGRTARCVHGGPPGAVPRGRRLDARGVPGGAGAPGRGPHLRRGQPGPADGAGRRPARGRHGLRRCRCTGQGGVRLPRPGLAVAGHGRTAPRHLTGVRRTARGGRRGRRAAGGLVGGRRAAPGTARPVPRPDRDPPAGAVRGERGAGRGVAGVRCAARRRRGAQPGRGRRRVRRRGADPRRRRQADRAAQRALRPGTGRQRRGRLGGPARRRGRAAAGPLGGPARDRGPQRPPRGDGRGRRPCAGGVRRRLPRPRRPRPDRGLHRGVPLRPGGPAARRDPGALRRHHPRPGQRAVLLHRHRRAEGHRGPDGGVLVRQRPAAGELRGHRTDTAGRRVPVLRREQRAPGAHHRSAGHLRGHADRGGRPRVAAPRRGRPGPVPHLARRGVRPRPARRGLAGLVHRHGRTPGRAADVRLPAEALLAGDHPRRQRRPPPPRTRRRRPPAARRGGEHRRRRRPAAHGPAVADHALLARRPRRPGHRAAARCRFRGTGPARRGSGGP